jgi:hypothetical protein
LLLNRKGKGLQKSVQSFSSNSRFPVAYDAIPDKPQWQRLCGFDTGSSRPDGIETGWVADSKVSVAAFSLESLINALENEITAWQQPRLGSSQHGLPGTGMNPGLEIETWVVQRWKKNRANRDALRVLF